MVSIDGIFKAFYDQSEMDKIFKLIWKNFSLIHSVMIHKTINTYCLNKPYNSLNLMVKL